MSLRVTFACTHLFALQAACRLPTCLQVVSTADLVFVFGSAAEIRDHLKNVKDSIKDRLIVPVTKEGQIDTFQVNRDTGDCLGGRSFGHIVGPFVEGRGMQGAMACNAQPSWPTPRWTPQKCLGPLVTSLGEACRLLRCCPASAEVVLQSISRAAVEASSPALRCSLAH